MTLATVILVPVLERPHRVAPLIENIAAATPEPHRVLFIVSSHDLAEVKALDAAGVEYLRSGKLTYPFKINLGYRESTEPLLFLGADDLEFHPGWLTAAQAKLKAGVDVVGTNDLLNPRVLAGEHSTHSLVRRSYVDEHGTIDRPGRVLHEAYPHEYCDDEFIETAQARGVYAHAGDAIVEHLHPYASKAPVDRTYRRGWSRRQVGRRIYTRRRPLWVSLSPSSLQRTVPRGGVGLPRRARSHR